MIECAWVEQHLRVQHDQQARPNTGTKKKVVNNATELEGRKCYKAYVA